MKNTRSRKHTAPLSQADKTAFLISALAVSFLYISPWLSLIPLVLFLLLCLIAPFCPGWGFFLPVISRAERSKPVVALSFDDGPSPESTPLLLELLHRYGYQASFFVIGEKAEQHPALIQKIIAAGHDIGNHSYRHDPLLMLRSSRKLHQDIRSTQEVLQKNGIRPLLFRPPAGITNPRLKSVLFQEQLQAVTFSCRAYDRGNRTLTGLARRLLAKVKPGDIVLLHDLPPPKEKDLQLWQGELTAFFEGLQRKELEVTPLERLIGSRVMLTEDDLREDT